MEKCGTGRPKQKWKNGGSAMQMHLLIKRAHHHTLRRAVSVKCGEHTYQLFGATQHTGLCTAQCRCENMWERNVRSPGTRIHTDAFVLVSYRSERTVHSLSGLHFLYTTIAAACTQTFQAL